MFIILGLTLFVAVWKRAIVVSDRLTPSGWALLGHLQFVLLIFCLMGMGQSMQRQRPDPLEAPRPTNLMYDPDLSRSTNSRVPQISSISPRPVPHFGQDQNISVNGSNFQSGYITSIHIWGGSTHSAPGASSLQPQVWSTLSWATNGQAMSGSCTSFVLSFVGSPDFPNPSRFFPRQENIVIKFSSPDSSSPTGVLFWVYLFGSILTPLTLVATAVLRWISERRAKAEAILRRAEDALMREAELEKLKLENQKLAFELFRAKQEAETPRIILG